MLNLNEDQNSPNLQSDDNEHVIAPLQNELDLQAWKQRQQAWYGHNVPLSPKNIRHLNNGGFIKEERRFAEYTKITSAWLSHKDYLYEQRIDYRFERQSLNNELGIKCIHIERDAQDQYRIHIECHGGEHYARLYTLLEHAGLPVLQTQKWAMLPYSFKYGRESITELKSVLTVIKSHTSASVAPILEDILQKFSTVN